MAKSLWGNQSASVTMFAISDSFQSKLKLLIFEDFEILKKNVKKEDQGRYVLCAKN